MARQTSRRRNQTLPGLRAAARALGVDYSHLRRVIIGERVSRSLLERYRQMGTGDVLQVASPPKPPR